MPHPLQQRLEAVRRRARRLVIVWGVCWVVAAVVAAVALLGLADYLLRFEDPGLRLICSATALVVAGLAAYRFLYLPLLRCLSDVDLALRVQRRFPRLGDRLVSAVEFLQQSEDDPLAGSAALRTTAIAEAAAATDQLDFADTIDPRPSTRAGMVSVAVCLVAAILIVVDPLSAQIALARLANPFGSHAWPRETHLALRQQVTQIARGDTFTVDIVDTGGRRLPADLQIHYRIEAADGRVDQESEPLPGNRHTSTAQRENVQRPFAYRVEGGDDHSQPWIEVEVIEPPRIDGLSIRLTPPAYTGWPPQEVERHCQALVGTAIEFRGTATRPLGSATLCFQQGRRLAARLTADGLGFQVPDDAQLLIVQQSETYWFELTDPQGIADVQPTRWEITAVDDLPPTAAIEKPDDTLYLTAGAVVPLTVVAKDDLALHQVALEFGPADGEAGQSADPAAQTRVLFAGPDRVATSQEAVSPAAAPGQRQVIDNRWELGPLGLKPGSQLVFEATAVDYRSQVGRSRPRRLVIITPEELQNRIAAAQNRIMTELSRVLDMQRESREFTAALEIRLKEIQPLDQVVLDRIQAAELSQRRVSRALADGDEGLPKQIQTLLADIENNRVDSPDVARRMEGLLADIDRLVREHLTPLGRELTVATKAAQIALDEPASAPAVLPPLGRGGAHQDAVITTLEGLLGELAQWDNYRRFHREISQLLHQQEAIREATSTLGQRTLSKHVRDLAPQERADVKVLARRQLELARRFDRIQEAMDRAAVQLAPSEPLAADVVADALAEARRLAIGAAMRSAGAHIEENRIGGAEQIEGQIVERLQAVLDVLANRREHELDRLVKKLKQAETDLGGLRARQAGLQAAMEQAVAQADDARRRETLQRLAREQDDLQKETERMVRRLERLLASRASERCGRAAGHMGAAGRCAAGGQARKAAEAAAGAENSLADAEQELARRRFEAQAALALEQLAQLQDALVHLRRQQDNALADTRRYAGLAAKGPLTPGQLAGLRDLAGLQRGLGNSAGQLGEKAAGSGAFQLALQRAARHMARAAGLLDRRRTADDTVAAQQQALAQLDMVLEALKPDSPDDAGDGPGGGTGAGGQQGGTPGGVQHLAELKLLKLLQQELNLRTQQLAEAVAAQAESDPSDELEFAEVRNDQRRLFELVVELMPVEQAAPEDSPAELPDVPPREPNTGEPLAPPPTEEDSP